MYKRHVALSEASERRNHSEVLYLNLLKKITICVVEKHHHVHTLCRYKRIILKDNFIFGDTGHSKIVQFLPFYSPDFKRGEILAILSALNFRKEIFA